MRFGTGAFSGCTGLTEINFNAEDCNGLSVGVFERAGANGSGITVTFGDSVKKIPANLFKNCEKVKSVTIGNNVTGIGACAFEGTGYYNDDANFENGVLYIGRYLIKAKEEISGNYAVNEGTLCIADLAFKDCKYLVSVALPAGLAGIGDKAFDGCARLIEVINASSLAITKTSYGLSALEVHTGESKIITDTNGYRFYTCDEVNYLIGYSGSATVLTLPDGYNDRNYVIYQYAFCGNESITSVTLPKSVTAIGAYAFSGCTALTAIDYAGTSAEWESVTKAESWIEDSSILNFPNDASGEENS